MASLQAFDTPDDLILDDLLDRSVALRTDHFEFSLLFLAIDQVAFVCEIRRRSLLRAVLFLVLSQHLRIP